MQLHTISTALLSGALLASPSFAQIAYNSNVGTAVAGVGDDTVSTVTLGFPFTFPDGTVATDVDIDSNGRIIPAGSDNSDFSETVAELLSGPASICVCWDDLSPQNGGGILFSTTATEAVITFENCRSFGSAVEYTVQCQLFADGRVGFVYDDRLRTDEEPLIGISEGGGAADPGGADISSVAASATTTVYEDFAANLDLQDLALEFTPDGSGGWTIVSGPANFPQQPIGGSAVKTVGSADSSILFSPDGSGGYTTTRAVGSWIDDSATGMDIGTGLGDDALTAPLALGFSFDFPGGNTVTEILVDNNGRILASDPGTSGDFNPSVAELLGDPLGAEPAPASICAFWTDLSSQNGTLRFSTDNVGSATISWDGVPQFGEPNALRFQVQLTAPGTIQINFRDIEGWTTGSGFTSDDVLIGISAGNSGGSPSVDPGESDFTTTTLMSAGDPTVYGFWDATNNEQPDVQHLLVSTSTPTLGGTLDVSMQGITDTSSMHTLYFGFFNPNTPLDMFGMSGGTLASSGEVQPLLTPVGSTADFSIALPLNPGFVGLINIHLQGAALTAPAETGFAGIVLTNDLHVTF